jgi:CRISPR-associated protein Cst2
MARQEGNPVPHEHQFYRTTLKGLYSLALSQAGVFSYRQRTGFRHLDDERVNIAKAQGLEHDEAAKTFRLPREQRLARVTALFDGMAQLQGGAKQTLHYTDVAPAATIVAVTKGGNHIFGHVIGATTSGQPMLKVEALQEALRVFERELLSQVYIGWTTGYADAERLKAAQLAESDRRLVLAHPRECLSRLVADLRANPGWLD